MPPSWIHVEQPETEQGAAVLSLRSLRAFHVQQRRRNLNLTGEKEQLRTP
jgi:hypothetical protein